MMGVGKMSEKKRLRWKKDKKPTGLARICIGPIGSSLHDGEKRYATVSNLHLKPGGWYWVAGWGSGVPHKNTCYEPVETEDQAKADAKKYVIEHLAMLAERAK